MDAEALIQRITDYGAQLQVEGDKVKIRGRPLLPEELVEQARAHKEVLRRELAARHAEDQLEGFLAAWREWIGGNAVGAWEMIVAMDHGFAPRPFREAAKALFGALPANPYDLGGYLAPYRGLEAGGLRLEDETITNDAGEGVRRYRVTKEDASYA